MSIDPIASTGAITPPEPTTLPDPKFWAAHTRWKALQEAWSVDPDETDAATERWRNKVCAAFCEMWLVPIRSAYALAAKLHSIDFSEAELPAPARRETRQRC